jgi:hypothetical protein
LDAPIAYRLLDVVGEPGTPPNLEGRIMPRKPNYRFERHERERIKAAKKAARAEAKAAKKAKTAESSETPTDENVRAPGESALPEH